MKLRRIPNQELLAIQKEIEAARHQENFIKPIDAFVGKYSAVDARVEMPLGELLNDKIESYVLARQLQAKIRTKELTKADRFNAQGLEGGVAIDTDFLVAFNVWKSLPPYRCNVYANLPKGEGR